jgi:hypothetical protein
MDLVTLGALVTTLSIIVAVFAVVVVELRKIDRERHGAK